MQVLWLLALLALVAFACVGFWRGVSAKPAKGYPKGDQPNSIAGASAGLYVDPHGGDLSSGPGQVNS
jgi:hypothetical protein